MLAVYIVSSVASLAVILVALFLFIAFVQAHYRYEHLNVRQQAEATQWEPGVASRPRSNSKLPKVYVNPMTIALLFCTVGGLFILVGSIASALATIGFPSVFVVIHDQDSQKRSPQALDNAATITTSLGYCLSVCTVVVLPLTWVSTLSLDISL